MLAQYLALQGTTNLRKSRKRNVKAVDSPQVNQERTFHLNLLVESFCIVFQTGSKILSKRILNSSLSHSLICLVMGLHGKS